MSAFLLHPPSGWRLGIEYLTYACETLHSLMRQHLPSKPASLHVCRQRCGVFAYGPTGSGKTYTIQGATLHAVLACTPAYTPACTPVRNVKVDWIALYGRQWYIHKIGAKHLFGTDSVCHSVLQLLLHTAGQDGGDHESRGLVHRALEMLFAAAPASASGGAVYMSIVQVSATRPWRLTCYPASVLSTLLYNTQHTFVLTEFLTWQVYNNAATDLLTPKSQTGRALDVVKGNSGCFYVKDLTNRPVANVEAGMRMYKKRMAARVTASTGMNNTSSRSHVLLTLTTSTGGSLAIVDLAGSENAAAAAGSEERLKEGNEIRMDLHAIGQVVSRMADICEAEASFSGNSCG